MEIASSDSKFMDNRQHNEYAWNGRTESRIHGRGGRRRMVLGRCSRKHVRGLEVTLHVQKRRCELDDTTSTSSNVDRDV
jgi:hypothetical protein